MEFRRVLFRSDIIFLSREVKRRSATRSASLYENSGKPPAYAVAGIRTGHRGREFRQIMDHASDTLPMSIRIGINSLRETTMARPKIKPRLEIGRAHV